MPSSRPRACVSDDINRKMLYDFALSREGIHSAPHLAPQFKRIKSLNTWLVRTSSWKGNYAAACFLASSFFAAPFSIRNSFLHLRQVRRASGVVVLRKQLDMAVWTEHDLLLKFQSDFASVGHSVQKHNMSWSIKGQCQDRSRKGIQYTGPGVWVSLLPSP